jgi:rhodanese-related sulfurtransferase
MNRISVEELKARIENGEKVNLLDVREPDERAAFNIGGVFIPLGDIMVMRTDEIEDLKNEEIICYCRSGKRSIQASMMLESFGFTNLVNLDGGMMAWQGM